MLRIHFSIPMWYDGSPAPSLLNSPAIMESAENWYAPPERKKTRQGDIYALGVIAHQLLTGRNPSYDTASNLCLHDVQMELPEDIQRMLGKFLAIRVTRRYKSCEEFLQEYEEFDQARKARKEVRAFEEPPPEVAQKRGNAFLYILIGVGIAVGVFAAHKLSGVFN